VGFDFVLMAASTTASDASLHLLIRSESVRLNAPSIGFERTPRSSDTNWLCTVSTGNLIDQALEPPGIEPQATARPGFSVLTFAAALSNFAQALATPSLLCVVASRIGAELGEGRQFHSN